MKKLVTFCLALFSISSFAQCVKCKSLEEAQKNVAMVKSIQINPYTGGELAEIPSSIGDFVNLEELYLTDLELSTVPKEIGKLKNLKSLSLVGNSLKELPQELFELQNLEELILFSNEFSKSYKATLKNELKLKLPKTKLMID
jgi:Leucine rich repeat